MKKQIFHAQKFPAEAIHCTILYYSILNCTTQQCTGTMYILGST